jgi:GTP-binding protein EngB required for normal cell division
MKNMKKNLKKESIIKYPIQDLASVKLNNISQKIEDFYEEYKREDIKRHNLHKLRKCINSSIGILKASKLLYIPLLGVSNAGKSTILNDLIGCKLLPVHQNECTKKGILIRYWNNDYPIMRKTKFKKDPYENYYYFESNEEIIANSIETIHEVLKGTNGKYVTKEENFFYEINIKIKFVEENLSLNNDLREKICFIDLPGFGTNNLFEEKNTYRHLMRSCHIFLFIVFNLKLKEEIN